MICTTRNQQMAAVLLWICLHLCLIYERATAAASQSAASPAFTAAWPSAVWQCQFNQLCVCAHDNATRQVREMRCIAAPIYLIPDALSQELDFLELISTNIYQLGENSLLHTTLETLRLRNNQISWIHPAAFRPVAGSLRTLDLSYNRLTSLPTNWLTGAQHISLLSLQRNRLSELKVADLSPLRRSLSQLYIDDNNLRRLPATLFSSFRQLSWLSLNGNQLREIRPQWAPRVTLQMLSANNNRISAMPVGLLNENPRIRWVYLRDNHLSDASVRGLNTTLLMDTLDLSGNMLRSMDAATFNGSVRVQQLKLDFNQLSELQPSFVQGTHVARLFMAHNQIASVHGDAFRGVGHSLTALDLSYNRLTQLPSALQRLNTLKLINLAANCIVSSQLSSQHFRSLEYSVRGLNLADNRLDVMPLAFLSSYRRLVYLNLAGNRMYNISSGHFVVWGERLQKLVLDNNGISFLTSDMFSGASSLTELRMSFNTIVHVDPTAMSSLTESLRSLELSYAFDGQSFPDALIGSLTGLKSLWLDNNGFDEIYSASLLGLVSLRLLNLEGNRLTRLPPSWLHASVHEQLVDVRLGHNRIDTLQRRGFHRLPQLRSVVLSYNRIGQVDNSAFSELPQLSLVFLDNNLVQNIAARAFENLPQISALDLQHNRLSIFSLNALHNVTNPSRPMQLNLSHNLLTELFAYPTGSPLYVSLLDVSFNRLANVPSDFLTSIAFSLKELILSNNKLTVLETGAFSNCVSLHSLYLRSNWITAVKPRAFSTLTMLQILDLGDNNLSNLPANTFKHLTRLTKLVLSDNQLTSLSYSLLTGLSISSLHLGGNKFKQIPRRALSVLSESMVELDLSDNSLEHIDAATFTSFSRLATLDLSHNQLTVLSDTVFVGLQRLVRLDLSHNHIRANYKEMFHYMQHLQELDLSAVHLQSAPDLPLPNLISLNLSRNSLRSVPFGSLSMMSRLRSLDLSRNKLFHVPSKTWMHTPELTSLDISSNDIEILNGESFEGLENLQYLNIGQLYSLSRFDSDTLLRMRQLTSLIVTTCPQIEKYRFRLGGVLSGSASLESLTVEVLESRLDDQLWGALGPLLRTITITGSRLTHIEPDCFQGLQNTRHLELSITGTSIAKLPDDLLRHLRQTLSITLILRNNQLSFVQSQLVLGNLSRLQRPTTKSISGGLFITDQHLYCDCHATWLTRWLHRWSRETMHVHVARPHVARVIYQRARQSLCVDPRTGRQIPVADITEEDMECETPSALNGSERTSQNRTSSFMSVIVCIWMWFICVAPNGTIFR